LRTLASKRLWIVFLLLAAPLSAQNVPIINPGGVVNAANTTSQPVAPGSIASIFGTNLSDGTICVSPCGPSFDQNGVLIPTMAGASVSFNGFAAPILSTPGPTQLNVQVPVEVAGNTSATVVVTVNGQSSDPASASLAPLAPGLFSVDMSGSGQGEILNNNDAGLGVTSLAAPWYGAPNAHTAQVGDDIRIHATGLGAMNPPVATGARPTARPTTATPPDVTIGGIPATVVSSGEASCCVGLNEIDVMVPPGVNSTGASTAANPVVLTIGGQTSNTVTIATGITIGSLRLMGQSVSGQVSPITRLGLDLPPGASATGNYILSGDGDSSSGETVYTLTGSGSGTLSSCQLISSSNAGGNWTASGTMTVTVSPAIAPGKAGVALGSYSAATSIAACGASLPVRTTYGAVLASFLPNGNVSVILVLPEQGALWPLTGTVDIGVSGLLITGGQIFGTGVTGGITVTSSLQSAASDSQTVYTLTGSGSGTLMCSLLNPGLKGTGNWNISVSSTFTLSPDPASLVNSGGSVSGTYSGFSGPASSSCGSGGALNPIRWAGGTVTGTVFPGGGMTLYLGPPH
jgi:uncharacterized protein (TIGR03437 family)